MRSRAFALFQLLLNFRTTNTIGASLCFRDSRQGASEGNNTMKKINLYEASDFSDQAFKRLLVHDSPYFKILNFNFKAGQELPVHSHDVEGQLSLLILEGEGEFLGSDGVSLPAKAGDVLISDISEPHGLRAKTALRLLVTIAPPI
jgi:quercetin dioxygenase-like cupin family protein